MNDRTKIIWSAVIALGFLLFSYWVTNLHFPISGERTVLYRFELLRNYLWPRKNVAPDSILLIDVSFDKTFITAYDDYGLPIGQTPITDRQKLLQLLQELRSRDDYRYILLDVFFGQNSETSQDSALFETIKSMKRIILPCHSDEPLADEALYDKTGLAEYTTTFSEVGFVTYPYLMDTIPSLPLKMYEEMTGRSVNRHGFIYTDGWKLVRKSIVLTYDVNVSEPYDESGQKNWYYLGADILGDENQQGVLWIMPELTKNKYIVIGAFQGDDIHSTYVGDVAGPIINFNAYLSLLNGHHAVSLTLLIVLYIAFFVLAYLTLTRQNLHELTTGIVNKKPKRFIVFISMLCTWIGYSLFLLFLCLTTYLILGEVYDIFITSTLFYLLHLAVKYTDNLKQLSKSWLKK